MYDSLKNSPSLLKQLFQEKFSAVSYYEEAKMIGRIRKMKGKNKTECKNRKKFIRFSMYIKIKY